MNDMQYPNLFIVGMPRAGTTSLSYYLREHPQVSVPPPQFKEPHYFSGDIHPPQVHSESEYLSLFEHSERKPVRAEASVFYLFSETAPAAILTHSANARIVICLREPSDWLPSLHAMLLRTGRQQESDLERAWNQGGAATGSHAGILDYPALFRISSHVERYLGIFGRERIHFMDYKSFCRDPKSSYERLLRFLGLETPMGMKYEKYNSRDTFWAKNLSDLHPGLRQLAMKIPAGLRHRLSDKIGALARRGKMESATPDDAFARMLKELSEREVAALRQLGVHP